MAVTKVEANAMRGDGVRINDIKVLGEQGAHIADLAAITGGEAPTEAEHNAVRTAFNSLLARLRAHGILASS